MKVGRQKCPSGSALGLGNHPLTSIVLGLSQKRGTEIFVCMGSFDSTRSSLALVLYWADIRTGRICYLWHFDQELGSYLY